MRRSADEIAADERRVDEVFGEIRDGETRRGADEADGDDQGESPPIWHQILKRAPELDARRRLISHARIVALASGRPQRPAVETCVLRSASRRLRLDAGGFRPSTRLTASVRGLELHLLLSAQNRAPVFVLGHGHPAFHANACAGNGLVARFATEKSFQNSHQRLRLRSDRMSIR